MSPLATLQRGYAVLQDADGHVVTSVGQAAVGSPLQVRVADGRIGVDVTGTESAELSGPASATPPSAKEPS
jgi:exodeoxyribonuclease VII large subunit